MLRKVLEFGSVLEHVCQLLVPKVADLEVIWGALLGVGWEVVLGASWRSICGLLAIKLGSVRSFLGVSLELQGVSRSRSGIQLWCQKVDPLKLPSARVTGFTFKAGP